MSSASLQYSVACKLQSQKFYNTDCWFSSLTYPTFYLLSLYNVSRYIKGSLIGFQESVHPYEKIYKISYVYFYGGKNLGFNHKL